MCRVGVILLILVAGCSGGGPAATDATSITPAPVPSGTVTETQDSRLPTGVAVAGGITDPWLVTTRSAELLSSTTYTLHIVEETRYANETVQWRLERVVRVGHNRSLTVETHVGHDRPGWPFANADRFEVYTEHGEDPTGARSYWAITEAGKTRYEELDGVGRANSRTLFQLLARFDTRVTGRAVRNGTILYQVEAKPRGEPKQMKYADRTERARNLTLGLLIDRNGVIHEWRVAYTTVDDGSEVRYVRTERVSDIASTVVTVPAWVDTLRDEETPTPVAAGSRSSGAEP